MNFFDFMRNVSNPKQYVMNYLKKNNNPIISNMVEQIEKGNTQEVENIARNLCKERGIDFDKQFAPFINKK